MRSLCFVLIKVIFSSRTETVVLQCITCWCSHRSDCVCLGSVTCSPCGLAQSLGESRWDRLIDLCSMGQTDRPVLSGTNRQTCAHWDRLTDLCSVRQTVSAVLGGTDRQTCARWSAAFKVTPAEHRHQRSTVVSSWRSSVEKILGRTQWYKQHPWSGREWEEKYWNISAHSTGCLIQQMSLIHLDFLILLWAHTQSCLTYAWILLNIT